jgi:hypothetical protein
MQSINHPHKHSRYIVGLLAFLPILLHLPFLFGFLHMDPMPFVAQVGGSIRQLLPGNPWIDPNTGFQAQALGKLSADQWLSGHIPWWNYYSGVGLPLAAEAQPGSLFLPFVLLYHFRNGGVWVATLLQILAGLCTYALLRKIRLSELAAFTGAALFELNGTFAWHGAPIISPIAFLPMLLLGIEHLFARISEERAGGWPLIPLAIALSLYSGFPESAYINGLLAGVWALTRVPELDVGQRYRYVGKLAGAAILGLVCSIPLIIPFAQMLGLSNVGGHAEGLAHAAPLHAASIAHSLMPWLFGPIFSYNDPGSAITLDWSNTGGYLTAVQVAFALLALQLAPRKLTFILAAWMLACVAKTFDIRPISDLINVIPLIKATAFYRYAPASWEFSGCVLAAFAIDSLRAKVPLNPSRAILTFLLVLLSAIAAIYLAWEPIKAVLHHGPSHRMTRLALIWLVLSLTMGAVIISALKPRIGRARFAAGLLVFDACLAFVMPLGSGDLSRQHEMPGITYLQTHIGLQRVYGMGRLFPNYGGYFKIAEINHEYLPVPGAWMNYIHEHLDAHADDVNFIGLDFQSNRPSTVSEELRKNLSAYEQIGVRYLLLPPGSVNPLIDSSLSIKHEPNAHAEPLQLANDQPLVITWQFSDRPSDLTIGKVSVSLGNYQHKSDGILVVSVCASDGSCAEGKRDLAESIDGDAFSIPLEHDLPIAHSNTPLSLSISLRQINSTYPVAIWVSRIVQKDSGQTISVAGGPAKTAPEITLQPAQTSRTYGQLAYSGSDMDIYELPNAAPYFQTSGGHCTVHAVSRERADVACTSPAQLLRMEAFYPGWHAMIDGKETPVGLANEIFQSVAISAGRHQVSFYYRPSHYGLIITAFGTAVLIWLFGLWQELKVVKQHLLFGE